jgi:hypothetical protein
VRRATVSVALGCLKIELVASEPSLNSASHPKVSHKRLLGILRQGLATEFPNPKRIGCPGNALLQGIAQKKVSLIEAEPWLEHLGSCSPCYEEFREFRRQWMRQRRPVQARVAVAAILLFTVAGWLWIRTRTSLPMVDTAMLDLRDRSPVRGIETEPALPPLVIPGSVKHLVLDLPIGSREGSYDVALLSEAGDEVVRTAGVAQLENHSVILRAEIDLERVRRGAYFLGIRQHDLKWTLVPARVV